MTDYPEQTEGSRLARQARDLANQMKTTTSDLPSVECPHCGGTWQHDEDLERGDTLVCALCEKTIHVTFVDITVTVALSTEKETA